MLLLYIMLIFRFIISFLVTTTIVVHALVLKKHIYVLILSSAAAVYPPSVWKAVLANVSWRPPLLNNQSADLSVHTRLSQHSYINSYLPNQQLSINYANAWQGDILWSHKFTELKAINKTDGVFFSVGERSVTKNDNHSFSDKQLSLVDNHFILIFWLTGQATSDRKRVERRGMTSAKGRCAPNWARITAWQPLSNVTVEPCCI